MATMTTSSFTSSVVTTLDGWRAFVEHEREPMDLLDASALGRLTPAERTAYDDERSDYHAELPALRTPVLDRTVTKGLLFMRLNRGQQMGTPCGMILSGVPGVGKTTAVDDTASDGGFHPLTDDDGTPLGFTRWYRRWLDAAEAQMSLQGLGS